MAQSTSLDIDQRIERMSKGREAAVVGGIIRPMIDDAIGKIVRQMTASYRDGTMSHDSLVGAVGQIFALQSLVLDLERVHKQGIAASEQERGNASS